MSVYRVMLDFHSQFLKAIKSVYPLGVLSSLSMTIAAFITSFAKESLALAQTYAIAASLMFLFAFSCSLVLRIFLAFGKNAKSLALVQYALISYICTGSGIAFLFLVVAEFVSVLSIAKALLPVLVMIIIGGILFPVPAVINIAKIAKSRSVLVLGYLTIICYLLSVLSFILAILSIYGIIIPLPEWWGYLLIGSLSLGLSCFSVMLILRFVQVHKRSR